MTDAATLLAEFVDALHAGAAPEAADYLLRAESDAQRVELAEGIEAVLDVMSDEAVHPRAADGSFVLSVPRELIARAARTTWPQAMPAWRGNAGLSLEGLADKVLEGSGLESSASNRSAARRWVEAIEAGAETTRSVSAGARAALADALGVAREVFDRAGEFETGAAVAFRAEGDAADDELAADALGEIAAEIDAALGDDQEPTAVDSWFSA